MQTGIPGSPMAGRPKTGGLSLAGAKRQRGQALVFSIFAAMLMVLALYSMYSLSGQAVEKIKLQNTADAAAYSAALAEARDYNFSAYTNRAMVANQVAVAQFVGLTSWFRNMSAFANGDSSNAGRDVYQMFFLFPAPLSSLYLRFLKGFGKVVGLFDDTRAGTTVMKAIVTVLDGLIAGYGLSQTMYHYSTALTITETLGVFGRAGDLIDDLLLGGTKIFGNLSILDGPGNIIKLNDAKAQMTAAGVFYTAYHIFKWNQYSGRMDPNTQDMDGKDADRFAQVTMDSLDDWSRDRSTKPAWGFSFFYAPPLTFIDPTRLIPAAGAPAPLFLPVIHRGGTELKLTDNSGGGGTGPADDPDGTTGTDCNGNPVNATASGSGALTVKFYSQLPASGACEGDFATVTDDDASGKHGVYAWDGGAWINPADMKNTTSSDPGGRTTPAASGGRGTKNNMEKRTWTAMDASSWAGLDLFWVYVPFPIPIPLPFAPPWMPLSHGAAQSGRELSTPTALASDNNFGVDNPSDAYGATVSNWTTAISGKMRQNKGAGKTLDAVSALGGLTKYMDIKTTTQPNTVGVPLVVEIEKDTQYTPKSPGTGRFELPTGAPEDKTAGVKNLRALSKAEVFFSRPTNDDSIEWFQRTVDDANQLELGSLYSPYWQARLAPNTFLEQYFSMEIQRAGR